MYKDDIHILCWVSKVVMRWRTAFCEGLLDLPPSMAWITPWLSDLMRKWEPGCPLWMAKSKPSSIAIISAHPILRPSLFQPNENFQASHSPPKTMPTPQEEDASTQNSTGEVGGGLASTDPQKLVFNWVLHHSISDRMLALGVFRMKGDDRKLRIGIGKGDENARQELPTNSGLGCPRLTRPLFCWIYGRLAITRAFLNTEAFFLLVFVQF